MSQNAMKTATVIPASWVKGVTDEASAREKYDAGKDFQLVSGSYMSVRDEKVLKDKLGFERVEVRSRDWKTVYFTKDL